MKYSIHAATKTIVLIIAIMTTFVLVLLPIVFLSMFHVSCVCVFVFFKFFYNFYLKLTCYMSAE